MPKDFKNMIFLKIENNTLSILITVLGPAVGSFLFKAAGFVDFPKFYFSHYAILFCFSLGTIVVTNWMYLLIRKLLRK